MKARDMVENYLLDLGISLRKNYTFIPNDEYEYSNKSGKTEVVTLGKYRVKLNKTLRNTREIKRVFNIASNNLLDSIKVSNDIKKTCDSIMGNSILYYAEFVKYISDNIDIKVDTAEKLMALAKGAMDNTAKELDKIIDYYVDQMNEAAKKGAEHRADLAASAIADITKVQGYYVTGYDSSTLFSDSYTIRATPYTMSDAKARERMEMASGAAARLESIFEEMAVERTIEKIEELKKKLTANFDEKFKELISLKLGEYFEQKLFFDVCDNVEDNPTVYKHYWNIIDELEDDQLEDFKKAIEYYNFSFIKGDLKKRVEDNMFKYYLKDFIGDYDKVDYKLYVCLEKDEFGPGSDICNRLRNFYLNNVLSFGKYKDNKETFESLDKKRELVNKCNVFNDSDKSTILSAVDKFVKKFKFQKFNRIYWIIISILLVIFLLLSVGLGIYYTVLMNYISNMYFWYCFFGVPIAIIIVVSAIKEG